MRVAVGVGVAVGLGVAVAAGVVAGVEGEGAAAGSDPHEVVAISNAITARRMEER
ncbi:MAG: hypothetical protein ACRDGE_02720 [Candidatus Limnocylindria bacterium]